jgi:very-short-patch-repair endonuclease
MFMSHVAFVIEYPGGPHRMFGELQHARTTPAKQAGYTLMRRYAERVSTNARKAK